MAIFKLSTPDALHVIYDKLTHMRGELDDIEESEAFKELPKQNQRAVARACANLHDIFEFNLKNDMGKGATMTKNARKP